MLICDEITLAKAQSSDLSRIITIWQKGWNKVHPNTPISPENIDHFIFNFKNHQYPFGFWVVKTYDSIAGWVSLLPAFYHPMKEKSDAEISIYIDDECANQGLGTMITKYVLNEIQHSRIRTVWAFVSLHNAHSKRMCMNAGLSVCGQTSSKYLLVKEY